MNVKNQICANTKEGSSEFQYFHPNPGPLKPPTLDVAIMLMARPASPEPPNYKEKKRSSIPLGSWILDPIPRTLIPEI